jgi:hypothetical protein
MTSLRRTRERQRFAHALVAFDQLAACPGVRAFHGPLRESQ